MTSNKDEAINLMSCDTLDEAEHEIARIRAESAEQERKEAAERIKESWRTHGEDVTLRILCAAILGEVKL